MVHTGPKNKVWKEEHRRQETTEGQRWKVQDREAQAYERLKNSYAEGVPAGDYRNIEGGHIKIVPFGGSFIKGVVTDEYRAGPPGTLWVPMIPEGELDQPFDWERYGAKYQDPFEFWSAMQLQVGFNELGYKSDPNGKKWRIFQLKQVRVVAGEGDTRVYRVFSGNTLDKTREYYCQAADGNYTIVSPDPAAI
ncbi:hypothetical protein CFE70_003199 [Pyrenophora teres f. teres 0-1]|uniref:Uncharacterized protein n=2 Tax=Pyrenophora teres f. teres TaxID=97479 RepID=E3RST0_PYRTT|nr:hypothetical protein PTT_12018 [Pyrenophora teres f. teres 0-1]KAE8846328.1 hypothetical protein HRS9139_00895 [Pyrenophora teres f. teres]CAA9959758.1 hypothetical protein PTMSG1_03166 [Pyrenophora teres f. maculata]KAE8848468.1 hypothetical protein PTNB85_02311 [Pyrenophora teres f. teres]KAE8853366.1 hypothetical protein HRS9122_00358 [Pyrenophora teres f. teres]